MDEETNIIRSIKARRYVSSALQFLLSREKRLQLREDCEYLIVNPSSSEDNYDSSNDFQQDFKRSNLAVLKNKDNSIAESGSDALV